MAASKRRRTLLRALFFMILRKRIKRQQKKNRRRFWVREIFKKRENKGAYNQILTELRLVDRENHFK